MLGSSETGNSGRTISNRMKSPQTVGWRPDLRHEEELVVLPWGLRQVFCLPILKAAFFLSCSPVSSRPEPGLGMCLEAL